ncbi:ABC transporter ATP-binding protein [Duganella sp. PWIR1]
MSETSNRPVPPQHAETIDVQAMPKILGRLVVLAARYPGRCAAALSCALGAAIFNLIMPQLLGRAVDQAGHLLPRATAATTAATSAATTATTGGAERALLITALLIVATCAIRGVLTGLQGYYGETLAQKVGYDLRLAYYDKLQQLSFSYHDRIHTGELIARGMLDLEGVRAFLEFGVLRVLTLLLLLGIGSWRLLSVDVGLGLLALSFAPYVLVNAVTAGLRLRVSWQRLQKMMAELTLRMEENLQGVRVVRAFHAVRAEMSRFDEISQRALRLSNARITTRMRSMSSMTLAYYISMALVLWVGGQRVAAGTTTVGELTEFLTFITILHQPLRQIGMVVNASARATSSGARLFDVLDAQPEIGDRPGAAKLARRDGPGADAVVGADAGAHASARAGGNVGVLRFERVGFGYSPGGRRVLEDISFELHPGQVLGIVGAPGSGKSTLAHLIPRFYDIGEGRITLGGRDIRDIELASLRREVALVQQENFLFNTSVHHNVAYAVPDAGQPPVIAAAQVAQIHDHVDQLPKQYGTQVGERGVALSGGQRQRMTIARALLDHPSVLVLDDSTAAIDAVTEQRVRGAISEAMRHAATIIIAHRLSSLHHADHILVLDHGRIVERGSHAELLERDGPYAELWRLQHRAAKSGAERAAPPQQLQDEDEQELQS